MIFSGFLPRQIVEFPKSSFDPPVISAAMGTNLGATTRRITLRLWTLKHMAWVISTHPKMACRMTRMMIGFLTCGAPCLHGETLLLGWKFLFCGCPIDVSFRQSPTSFDPMKICAHFASLLKIVTPAPDPVSQRRASKCPEIVILLPFFE